MTNHSFPVVLGTYFVQWQINTVEEFCNTLHSGTQLHFARLEAGVQLETPPATLQRMLPSQCSDQRPWIQRWAQAVWDYISWILALSWRRNKTQRSSALVSPVEAVSLLKPQTQLEGVCGILTTLKGPWVWCEKAVLCGNLLDSKCWEFFWI